MLSLPESLRNDVCSMLRAHLGKLNEAKAKHGGQLFGSIGHAKFVETNNSQISECESAIAALEELT